jgi:hypothetical protein
VSTGEDIFSFKTPVKYLPVDTAKHPRRLEYYILLVCHCCSAMTGHYTKAEEQNGLQKESEA